MLPSIMGALRPVLTSIVLYRPTLVPSCPLLLSQLVSANNNCVHSVATQQGKPVIRSMAPQGSAATGDGASTAPPLMTVALAST